MLVAEYIVSHLAVLMFNNMGDDLYQGATTVGLVVRNRILAGWHGQDWIAAIQNFYSDSDLPAPTEPLKLGDPVRSDKFRRILAIAGSIYDAREKDITCGATRFCILSQASEEFCNKIIRPKDPETGLPIHPRVAQVGQRSFFK